MPKFQRVVFTIHGINHDKAWQAEVASVLEPHFPCVPLSYPGFRLLGSLKIFSRIYRKRAVKRVAQQISRTASAGERPHLIAHSFGTWIAAELMKRPGIQFDRVIFAGSPLPADFDWIGELADNPEAFNDLVNEIGLEDSVIPLANLAGSRAGVAGFKGHPDLIHDGAIRVSCSQCKSLSEQAQARIHNLSWRHLDHSGWFVGTVHSANLWLPYLWGFAPEEYSDFIESCLRIVEMDDQGDWQSMKQVESEFRSRQWSWTKRDGKIVSLSEYVHGNVCVYLEGKRASQSPENIADRAIRLVWTIVGEALAERRKLPSERKEDIVRRLHPKMAVAAAICAAATES